MWLYIIYLYYDYISEQIFAEDNKVVGENTFFLFAGAQRRLTREVE